MIVQREAGALGTVYSIIETHLTTGKRELNYHSWKKAYQKKKNDTGIS